MHAMSKSRLKSVLGAALFGTTMLVTSLAEAKTITVWCWDPNFNVAIMKEAGARYAKTHPDVTVTVVDFSKSDVEQKLQAGLSSGVAAALPDIVLIEDYGAQKYLQSFPGAFAPLSGLVDHKAFAPYKVELMTLEGKVYGVPFDSGVTGLYYRRDYVEAAGYKPADMQNITWDKFIEIGKAVEAKTGKKMMGYDSSDAGLTRIIMQSAGQWYFTKDGKLNIEGNPALKAALEVQQKIQQANIYKPATGWNDWVAKFTSGDVAAAVTGVWITGTIKAQKDQAGKWGVAPIPKLDLAGAVAASNLGGSSWYVTGTSKVKAEAADFLNSVYAKDAEFYQKILQERGAVGSLLAARSGPAYGEADAYFGGEKIWQSFATWIGQIPPVNYGIFTNEVDAAVAVQLPRLGKGTSVDEAVKAIAAQAKTQVQ